MLRLCIITILAVLMVSAPLRAEDKILMVDLADQQISITTGFNGARLSLFGYKRQAGDLAVTVTGPQRPMVVRKKEPFLGLWMNREAISFLEVPVYYDYALSKPVQELAPPETLKKHVIGLGALDFRYAGRKNEEKVNRFREALIRTRQTQGHFPLEPKKVIFLNNDFFRVDFHMPANVPTGNYIVRTFLFEEGRVADISETQMRVAQVGFNAGVYKFAHQNELAYALFAVLFAVFSGWFGYALMSRK